MTKPLSWAEIRIEVDRFVHEYKGVTSENGESQSFWNDFLACFGVARRRVASFEKRATRASTNRTGRIDLFWPKVLIAEQKSTGKLKENNAEEQAEDYLLGGDIEAHEYPKYILSSDFANMQITDLESPPGQRTQTFPLSELASNLHLFGFIAGYQVRQYTAQEEVAASVKAAQLMADLYAVLTGDADSADEADPDYEDDTVQQASMLLTRLLFLMYGDDAGLWEKGLFEEFIETRTQEDGSDLGAQIIALFSILNTPESRRSKHADALLLRFPFVNGSLFDGHSRMPFFNRSMRNELLAACRFEWRQISPAVFGSLFQAIKSKKARREAGEHYTTETNILKTLRPLFLDDLRVRLSKAWNNPKRLRDLHAEFADIRYLDPACGCGNFLIVAYREMRQIELDLLVRIRELAGMQDYLTLDGTFDLKVSLSQFYGIELNWWPAKIAETAMFLVDHQANQRMALALGLAPDRLPIRITAHIHHGNALQANWKALLPPSDETYVFGNPPFLGKASRTSDQLKDLITAWQAKLSKQMDYVTAWHAKTLDYFKDCSGTWAFVTTNSIVQGEPVIDLFRPIFEAGWRIKFAHRTFEWTSEAAGKAAVHCVIVGFTKDSAVKSRLFDYATPRGEPQELLVERINSYLVDGPIILVSKRSVPISTALPRIALGSQPSDGGHLIVEPDEYDQVMADPVAAKYVRGYVGGRELVRGTHRWCLWLTDLEPSDLAKSPLLKARLAAVKENRARSTYESTRKAAATPHLFWYINEPTGHYLCLPRVVSDSRRYFTAAYLPPSVISNDKTYVVPDSDGFLFGITASSMFITWQKTIGGRMKSDVSMSNTVAWNNFPLPAVDSTTREKIIKAGRGVLAAREKRPGRSLAEHYNPLAMDPKLVRSHNTLDAIVDRAFGAQWTCKSEAERQSLLFANFAALSGEA